jgi:SAM-dependent methyltransferase
VSVAYAEPKCDLIVRHAAVPAGGRILDVGTGNGTLFAGFARGYRCVGVDTSEHQLARHCAPGRVALADGEALPFPDGSFDLVVESCVLHHVPEPRRLVGEMARVARSAVALVEPNMLNPLSFAFHALVPEERGALSLSRRDLREWLPPGFTLRCATSVGLVYPTRTPTALLPFLRVFDRSWTLGNVHVIVAVRDGSGSDRSAADPTTATRP